MRRVVILIVAALAVASTCHALLGTWLRTAGRTTVPFHATVTLGQGSVSATGDSTGETTQIASVIQTGTVAPSNSSTISLSGAAVTAAPGSAYTLLNGVRVIRDDFTGSAGTLAAHDANWVSFGGWDETYGYKLANLRLTGSGLIGPTTTTAYGGACYTASNSDTSVVKLKAVAYGYGYRGPTVRSGNGTSSTKGYGYRAMFATWATNNWKRIYFYKNTGSTDTIIGYTNVTVSANVDHELKLVASGTTTVTLSAYLDGSATALATATDSTPLPKGHPGFFIEGNASAVLSDLYIDYWNDGGGNRVEWTTKPPAGTPLRADGHWSVNGLVAAYPLNEGSGLPKDIVSNVSATSMTATWGSDGIVCTGNQSVSMPSTALTAVNPTEATLIAGITWDGGGQQQYNDLINGYGYHVMQIQATAATLRGYRYINGTAPMAASATLLPTGSRMTLASVFPAGLLAPKIYINGTESGYLSTTNGSGTTLAGGAVTLMSASGNTQGTVGAMHWALIYNRALSPSEVQSLTNNPYQIFELH